MFKVAIALFLCVYSMADAATYNVSKSGSDSNAGTQSAPWLTIQKAANTMVGGDTAIIQAGNYAERVTVSRSGSSSAPIVFRADGAVTMKGFALNADNVTISGFRIINLDDGAIGIRVTNSGNCVIENNDIRYTTMGGISLWALPNAPASVHDCIVRNNTLVRNGQYGLEIMGVRHLVENNEVSHTVQHHPCNISNRTAGWLDADGIDFHGDGHVFRGNTVHHIGFGGSGYASGQPCSVDVLANLSIDLNNNPHIDCFQTFGPVGNKVPATNVTIERNHCHLPEYLPDFSLSGKAFQIAEARNVAIKNNVWVGLLAGLAIDSVGIQYLHNTFYGDPSNNFSQGLKFTNSTSIVVKNNIFAEQNNGVGTIWPNDSVSAGGINAGFNCVWRSAGPPKRAADRGDVWGVNPQFVSAPGDLHLQSTSTCIDAATNLAINDDHDGNARPQGNGYDMGAYEFGGTVTPPPPPPPDPEPEPTPLAAPSNLAGQALSSSEVRFSWRDNSGDETGFQIERNGRGTKTISIGANLTQFTDTDLRKNTTYDYRIRGVKGSTVSAWSNTIRVRTPSR
jgi:hypothetical protein